MKILFKNYSILQRTDKGEYSVLKNACLATKNEKIAYIGPGIPEGDFDEVRSGEGKILIPGLFNCHTHSPMVLLRGVGSDLPLDKWLFGEVCPIEDRLTREDIEAGSNLALMEMLSGGTVSFSDMYFEPDVTPNAVIKSGMKANLSRPIQSFDPAETPEQSYRLKQAKELYDSFNGAACGRILIDKCIHAEYTCTDKIAAAEIAELKAVHGNLHIHLSETVKEQEECVARHGKTPAEWFESLGAFDEGCFAAHCVTLTDSDMQILKRHNVTVVHNPTSNLKLASGFAPVPGMLEKSVNVALGTDGAASNNNLSVLEEMHLAGIIHNGFLRDATLMRAGQVLDMATVNGAKCQRRADCGEIKVGNFADIVELDTSAPNMQPVLDIPALLVYSAGDRNISMTMVNGRILYDKGEFKTIDAEKAYYYAKKSVNKLYGG